MTWEFKDLGHVTFFNQNAKVMWPGSTMSCDKQVLVKWSRLVIPTTNLRRHRVIGPSDTREPFVLGSVLHVLVPYHDVLGQLKGTMTILGHYHPCPILPCPGLSYQCICTCLKVVYWSKLPCTCITFSTHLNRSQQVQRFLKDQQILLVLILRKQKYKFEILQTLILYLLLVEQRDICQQLSLVP